jgi:hypothetical protein
MNLIFDLPAAEDDVGPGYPLSCAPLEVIRRAEEGEFDHAFDGCVF